MTVYSPKEKNTGVAIVVLPGGVYQGLGIDQMLPLTMRVTAFAGQRLRSSRVGGKFDVDVSYKLVSKEGF
jgi:hypothetical protein